MELREKALKAFCTAGPDRKPRELLKVILFGLITGENVYPALMGSLGAGRRFLPAQQRKVREEYINPETCLILRERQKQQDIKQNECGE